jgi:hypothetical protein
MIKNIYLSLAISIGVLAGVITAILYLLPPLFISEAVPNAWPIMVPPAFIAWALYFAHGQGKVSFWKTGLCNTIGVIVAVIITIIAGFLTGLLPGVPAWGAIALGIAVILGGGWMTFEATCSVVDYVPAAFCGCATTFAFGFAGGLETNWALILVLIVAFWIGLVCAWLSDKWGAAMMVKEPAASDEK